MSEPLPAAAPTPAPARTRGRGAALAVLLVSAAVVFGVDHLTKSLVTRDLALGEQTPASGPVTIHHVENQGAAFGLFPQLQLVFLGAAVLVSAYILVVGPRLGGGLRVQAILGLILGGATANAADRLRQGYVVDFVDLHRWPVFNVADACIVVGIAGAVLVLGSERRPPRAQTPAVPP